MATVRRSARGGQFAALTRTFLARFFDNEITDGTNDVLQGFFWIVTVLSVPGALIAVILSVPWTVTGKIYGVVVLRYASQPDKALFLGLVMIGSALVSALVWTSLLVDRRDALILGTLPVRASTIATAKLSALLIYVGLIAGSMAGTSSVLWGFLLASGRGATFGWALRGIVAHFVATAAASACVLLFVAALEGLAMALLGPRIFARASIALQAGLVLAIGAAMLVLPRIPRSVGLDLYSHGASRQTWVLNTPPVWFLGLYEWTFGTLDPDLRALAAKAGLTLATVAVTTIVTQAISCRRVLRAPAIESVRSGNVGGGLARLTAWLVARQPNTRAVVEFFVNTALRVDRHRLILGATVGAALAWTLPTLTHWVTIGALPKQPQVDLLTFSISLMVFLLVGLRLTMAVPSDLRAAWVFDIGRPRIGQIRGAMERLLILLGVLPVLAGFLPVPWRLWGPQVALVHTAFAASVGLLLVQLLLSGLYDVPCTGGWRPERAQFRVWWPAYLGGFLWLANGMPLAPGPDARPEYAALEYPAAAVLFIGLFLVAAAIIRWRAVQSVSLAESLLDEPAGTEVLNLN